MEAKVKWNNESFEITITSPQTTLKEFKEKLFEKTGVSPEHQTLAAAALIRVKDDSITFGDLKIYNPSKPWNCKLFGKPQEQIKSNNIIFQEAEQQNNVINDFDEPIVPKSVFIEEEISHKPNRFQQRYRGGTRFDTHEEEEDGVGIDENNSSYSNFSTRRRGRANETDEDVTMREEFQQNDEFKVKGPDQESIIRLLDELGTNEIKNSLSEAIATCGIEICQGTFNEAITFARSNHLLLVVLLYNQDQESSKSFILESFTNELVKETLQKRCAIWFRSAPPQGDSESVSKWMVSASQVLYLERTPYIGICLCSGSQINLVEVIQQENLSVDELVVRLMVALEVHGPILDEAIAKATDEMSSSNLRSGQDQAYQQALLEEQQKEAEELKAQKEAHEKEQMIIKAQLEEINKKEEIERKREIMKKRFLIEPDPSIKKLKRLKIRTSDGISLTRPFYSDATFQDVADFLFSEGFTIENMIFVQTHPNKQFSDFSVTLENAEILDSAILYVEWKK